MRECYLLQRHLSVLFVLLFVIVSGCRDNPFSPDDGTPLEAGSLRVETVVSGLDTPWDLAWGPDGMIWVTERRGVISRVDPTTGELTQVGQIPDVVEVSESGLMGLALHPDFDAQPFVYVMYSFRAADGSLRNRLARLRFDGAGLGNPETLLDDIPGAPNHNGSRLAVGRDDRLYVTTGDSQNTSLPQNVSSVAGKVLRLTLDGQPAPGNPFGSAVYSYGHRNPQGLVFHPDTGDLYLTEHGPNDNDEVNRVEAGGNYGWPNVRGFCDGDAPNELAFCQQNDVIEPVEAWTPTIAVAGADFYDADLIPGWRGSLLVTTLAGRTLLRLTLSGDGSRAVGQESLFRNQFGRLRDVLVGPLGEIYLATSNRDGRGSPTSDDDRILRIVPEGVLTD